MAKLVGFKANINLATGQDSYIVASCPTLKGCWSQGKTEGEAISNIKRAIALYLDITEEQVSINQIRRAYD